MGMLYTKYCMSSILPINHQTAYCYENEEKRELNVISVHAMRVHDGVVV